MTHSCNCMYGANDPRCCIQRAWRKLLEDAWEMGRRGEPLPPVPQIAQEKLILPPVEDWHGKAQS